MRTFTARFFAVIALGTAALFTPILTPFLSEAPISMPAPLAIGLPFLAAACAYGWAWLLYPRADAPTYGPLRGTMVALLAYLSFAAVLAAVTSNRGALYLLVAFVWTPFPYLSLAAGAIAGEANLRDTRARTHALVAATRVAWVTCIAILRITCVRLRDVVARLEQRAAHPRASAAITTVVSSCLLGAGGALGLAWLHPQVALADTGSDLSLQLLPGAVALILAVLGWTCGRVLLTAAPATYRLRIAVMAVTLASVAAVQFWTNVAA